MADVPQEGEAELVLVPFRARARTVDHLGREQIADCPTAISELWKNAYDAYAKSVGLHIFDGELPVAAVVDDGHGMSAEEFVDRWLMLGTEAKAGKNDVPVEDRNGLPQRPRQGQKGIGRLSVAYLGPTVLVLTKRRELPFVAALIDWRLFQNPYLALDDVQVPLEEFSDTVDFPGILSKLFDGLVDNVWGGAGDPERQARLESAWQRFSNDEIGSGECSADCIAGLALAGVLDDRHLSAWPAWSGEKEMGTALFVFDVGHELRVWIDPSFADEDPEIKETRDNLRLTLTGFIDPYSDQNQEFRYEAIAHRGACRHEVVSSAEMFDIHDLRDLEHVVEGRFDQAGLFKGRVRAWGQDLGEVTVAPSRPPPAQGSAFVGEFDICFGTFEQEVQRSTHTADVIARLKERALRFSGLAVYRNGIRVQPYGRPQADFFRMDLRRQMHAGREFWAHRRTFGRVAITQEENSRLRDKAGREGIIDNRAAREFRLLVVDLLKTLARRYYGSDSDVREANIEEAKRRYEQAKAAEKQAGERRLKALRKALTTQGEDLEACLADVRAVLSDLKRSLDPQAFVDLNDRLEELRRTRTKLALPPRPRKLSNSLEDRYRTYRDSFAELTATLERASTRWSTNVEADPRMSHAEVANSALARHQKFITDATSRWKRSIRALLKVEQTRWSDRVDKDNTRYYALASPLVKDVAEDRLILGHVLSEMEGLRERIYAELAREYEAYLRALGALGEGIDIDEALAWAIDERMDLQNKAQQWQDLAQLGITVEIIGHELNDSAAQVSRNLLRLPSSTKKTEAYKLAKDGFQALVHRLKFLAPLRLSGSHMRETISGKDIEEYLRSFFKGQIAHRRVDFSATPEFKAVTVVDYPHRLYPVFVNLVNNALYWVTFDTQRKILLDRIGNRVFVADSGPGVDPDDIPQLFQMFFTRKVGGHGVGLFLSRVSLEQGRHRIRYADPDEGILPGANFIIEFQDLQNE